MTPTDDKQPAPSLEAVAWRVRPKGALGDVMGFQVLTDKYAAQDYAEQPAFEVQPLYATTDTRASALSGEVADLRTITAWLDGLATCPDLDDVCADGGVTVGMAYQQEAREFAGRLRRVLTALDGGQHE